MQNLLPSREIVYDIKKDVEYSMSFLFRIVVVFYAIGRLVLVTGVVVVVVMASAVGAGVVVAVRLVLCKLLLAHVLEDLNLQILKCRKKTLWGVLCCVVSYGYGLGCNVALNALYALAVEVVVNLLCATLTVDICDKYGPKLGWIMICLGIIIMSLLILATGSRASILSGVGLITVALLYKLPIRKIRYQIAFIVFAAAIGFFALAQHPRMSEVNLKQELRTNVISKEQNPRLNIWRIALENRSEYSAYGIGAGQSFGYLQLKYREHQIYHYRQLNAHNQYLEEWIEIGIPGMIFFILAWMSILYCATDKGRKTATLLVTLYGLNMLTDCMFGRFDGIALWATFMILILLQSDTQCHQQASGDAQ